MSSLSSRTTVTPSEEAMYLPTLTRIALPFILGGAVMAVAGFMAYRVTLSQREAERVRRVETARTHIRECLEFLRAQEFEAAEEAADRAVALNPDSDAAFLFRAEARAGLPATGDLLAAESDYSRCLKLAPEEWLAFYGRAHVRLRLGKTQLALKDFDTAITINPNFAAAYQGRALARRRSGDLDGSKADALRARELGL